MKKSSKRHLIAKHHRQHRHLLVKELTVLCEKQDLLMVSVPCKRSCTYAPKEWDVLLKWS